MNLEDLRHLIKEQEKFILSYNFGALPQPPLPQIQPPPPQPPPQPPPTQQVQSPAQPSQLQSPVQPSQSAQPPQSKSPEVKTYQCDQCGFESQAAENLILHKLREHEDASPFQCSHCGFNTTSKWRLEKHTLIHTGAYKTYQCGLCNFTATSRYYLDKHNLEHAGISEPFQCKLCGFSASSKYYLDKHKVSHTGDASPYKCNQCVFSASSKYFLKKHKLTMHSGLLTSYRCDQCDFDTSSKYYLNKHKRSKHENFTQPFENEQNKFGAESPEDLDKNKPERSAEVFPCDLCDFRATSKYNLEKHKILHVNPTRPVLCNDCGFSPVTQMDFLKHAIYHQKLNTPFFSNQFEIDAALKYFYEAQKQNTALNLIQTEKSSTVTNSSEEKPSESPQNESIPVDSPVQQQSGEKPLKKMKPASEMSKQSKSMMANQMKSTTNSSLIKEQENVMKVNPSTEMKLSQLCNPYPLTANDMNRNQFLLAGKPFQSDQSNTGKSSSLSNNKPEQFNGTYYCGYCGSTKYPTQDSIFSCEMCFFSALNPIGLFSYMQEYKDGFWPANFSKGGKNMEVNPNMKGVILNNTAQAFGGIGAIGKNLNDSVTKPEQNESLVSKDTSVNEVEAKKMVEKMEVIEARERIAENV